MPLAKIATRVMFGDTLRDALAFYDNNMVQESNGIMRPKMRKHIAIKEAVFPFNKLSGADLILGPEMKSTGEVMGISDNFGTSFAKAQDGAKNFLPKDGGKVFISLCDLDKEFASQIANGLIEQGFEVVATDGTFKIIRESGIACTKVLKVSEGRPNITDSLANEEIVMAINTSDGEGISVDDGLQIRRMVLRMNVPYVTTVAGALASVEAIKASKDGSAIEPKAIQDFLAD
jgi:carbamoyl-phosphate synthase large subunit